LKNAKKRLEMSEFDVVISDVKLPDGSGVEFSRIIKEKHPATE
jgi:DNA-binding NtrC family response regulator